MKCQIDTCGENRLSGEPWEAVIAVRNCDGNEIHVCDCHAEGWDESDG